MEVRDLYDINRNKLEKTTVKGIRPKKGEYWLVVFIMFENIDGRFLIQKRSLMKGGKWSITAGHPKANENSYQGLLTEVKEELGINIKDEAVIVYQTEIDDYKIVDCYYAKINININDLKLQKKEVQDVKLATFEEIEELINKGKFLKKHIRKFYEFKENYLKIKNKYTAYSNNIKEG